MRSVTSSLRDEVRHRTKVETYATGRMYAMSSGDHA